MFKLPNGKEIDVDLVKMALEGSEDDFFYLNLQTGEVDFASNQAQSPREMEEFMEKVEDNSDYVPIESISSREKYQWMRDFVKDMVEPQDEQVAEKLFFALHGPRPFRRFKDMMYMIGDEWKQPWFSYEAEQVHEAMKEWFKTLPVEIIEE